MRLIRRRGDRASRGALTDSGDSVARAFAGLPNIHQALAVMDRLNALRESPDGWSDATGLCWVRETDLAGIQYEATTDPEARTRLVELEEELLPAMVPRAGGVKQRPGRASFLRPIARDCRQRQPTRMMNPANPTIKPEEEGLRRLLPRTEGRHRRPCVCGDGERAGHRDMPLSECPPLRRFAKSVVTKGVAA